MFEVQWSRYETDREWEPAFCGHHGQSDADASRFATRELAQDAVRQFFETHDPDVRIVEMGDGTESVPLTLDDVRASAKRASDEIERDWPEWKRKVGG